MLNMKQAVMNLDARYTITKEYAGYPLPVWVARFCDGFIAARVDKEVAEMLCHAHAKLRTEELEEGN